MTEGIRIELTPQPLERVESAIVVAGFFRDERPLRGGAARADWRLCGGLSKRIAAGSLSGNRGEALLIGSGRALRSPRLLLLGLGERAGFDAVRLREETREAVQRCLRLGCHRIGLTPLGVAPDDVPRHAQALLDGFREARTETAAGSVHLSVCVRRAEVDGVARALAEACRKVSAAEVHIQGPEQAHQAESDVR